MQVSLIEQRPEKRFWKRSLLFMATVWVLAMCLPVAAWAQGQPYTPQDASNTMWTVIAAMLVMFMQPGFTMLECGLVRGKNAGNILMKNFADLTFGGLGYFFIGFGLMFGTSAAGIIGIPDFTQFTADATSPAGEWTLTFYFFQAMFAATAATIVSGAVSERAKFSTYIIASVIITAIIYPISGSWSWNGLQASTTGWLEDLGFMDFAGSSVVHSVGGWLALAGAWVVGPRIGKYGPNGEARSIPGHNLPLAALGVMILWFAWFGFNCGSTTFVDGTLGYIGVNTFLAACAGVVGAMSTIWIKTGKPDPSMSFNGCLAGLVGITAGCFEVAPVGAIIIGLLSGILVIFSILFIDQKLKIDDPVGAVSVHGVCGFFGTLMVGLFAAPGFGEASGLFYGGGITPLLIQLLGASAYFVWAFGLGLVLFKILAATIGVRVSREEELKGLDMTEHGADVYSGFQIFSNE